MSLVHHKLMVTIAVLGLLPSVIVASYLWLSPVLVKDDSYWFMRMLPRGATYAILVGIALCTFGLLASFRSLPQRNDVDCELVMLPLVINQLQRNGMNSFAIYDRDDSITVMFETFRFDSTKDSIRITFEQKKVEPAVQEHMLSLPNVDLGSRDEDARTISLNAHADVGENFNLLMPVFLALGLTYSDSVIVMYQRIDVSSLRSLIQSLELEELKGNGINGG